MGNHLIFLYLNSSKKITWQLHHNALHGSTTKASPHHRPPPPAQLLHTELRPSRVSQGKRSQISVSLACLNAAYFSRSRDEFNLWYFFVLFWIMTSRVILKFLLNSEALCWDIICSLIHFHATCCTAREATLTCDMLWHAESYSSFVIKVNA